MTVLMSRILSSTYITEDETEDGSDTDNGIEEFDRRNTDNTETKLFSAIERFCLWYLRYENRKKIRKGRVTKNAKD